MEDIHILSAFHHCLKLMIIAVSLITLPTLVTGVIISILQAATQVNEMSLTFIPKLIVMFLVLFLLLPWLLHQLVDVTQNMMFHLPRYLT
ncbi:flagellar type III secretion system protein FliQ [Legionella israelensis]|uniref:flagellar biosynthetic protein FliQ n=1 Tax=Legionella israelensis TaxID=454 RepID=UPI00117CA32E|nr:flagellar biosynthetic protein FliQ [Legionella israelensis]QDP73463.1 flagellar type III secretion system protein FliQ [Legionella israelensis]